MVSFHSVIIGTCWRFLYKTTLSRSTLPRLLMMGKTNSLVYLQNIYASFPWKFEPSSLKDIALEMTSRQYLFTLSVKTWTFNSTEWLKTTIVSSEEVPYTSRTSILLKEIHALTSCIQPIACSLWPHIYTKTLPLYPTPIHITLP